MRRIKFEIIVTDEVDINKPHPFDEGKPHEPKFVSLVGIKWSFEDRAYGNSIQFDKPTLTDEEIADAGKELLLSAMDAARTCGIAIETHSQWSLVPGTNHVVKES